MNRFFSHCARFDWLLLGAVFLLITLGLLSLFSLRDVSILPFFGRQMVWMSIGLFLLVSVSFIDFRVFRTQTSSVMLLYGASIVMLVALLLFQFKIRDVAGWFNIGGVLFQPVEVTKLALVILFAKFFSKRHVEIYRIRHVVVSGIYLALPLVLVLLQPDLGSAIVLCAIWLAIILFSGMKIRHVVFLFLFAVVISAAGWNWGLAPYQKLRITSFLNPYADSQGAGYQMIQSMIAVGSGKIWGKGLGYGSQSHLNFLPEAETDFIFAAFAEEWGFFGSAVLMLLFVLILWRIIRIGRRASDNFSRLFSIGFAALIFSQSVIHIGMNMGVLPITGITLPFVSYGGSSLVSLLAGIGILQNINIHARRDLEEA